MLADGRGNLKCKTEGTYIEISSLSVSNGSQSGGTKLHISGNYFDETDSSPVKVFVGGNRGVYVYIQKGISNPFQIDKAQAIVEHRDESSWAADEHGPHAIQMIGYFIPTYSGHYGFCMNAASRAYLYFSLSSDPNDKEGPAYNPYSYVVCCHGYYIEVYYGSDLFPSNVKLIAYLWESPFTSDVTGLAESEVQEIVFHSEVSEETQTLFISTQGASGAASSDVQTVTITGNLDRQFSLGLNGAFTVPMKVNELTSSAIQFEIKRLPNVVFPVDVNFTMESGQAVLIIMSSSSEGAIDMYQAKELGNSNELTFSYTRIQDGKPNLSTFTLGMDGLKTPPIKIGSNATEVWSI
ncbi:hypothetical protein Btru_074872 [Bulinus truncatus]|nr:hypothetical protein Btru_074872 [Bulinus truncatus]